VVCMSGQKQLAMANFYYAEDWKGVLPHSDEWLYTWKTNAPDADPPPESGALFGYQKSTKYAGRARNYAKMAGIYLCPMDQGSRTPIGGLAPLMPARFSYTRNVYINLVLVDLKLFKNTSPQFRYLPLRFIKRSSDTPLMVEEYERSPMDNGMFWGPYSTYDRLTMRHYAKSMNSYYDMHVAAANSKEYNETTSSTLRHTVLMPGFRKP
jgi:hypothetical protein